MSSAVNIGAVFYLYFLFHVRDQAPELALHVVLCDRSVAFQDRVERHPLLEVTLLEVGSLLLELTQGVEAAFLEAELSITNEASGAVPVGVWLGLKGWVQASAMIRVVARLTDGKKTGLFSLAAVRTFLLWFLGFSQAAAWW